MADRVCTDWCNRQTGGFMRNKLVSVEAESDGLYGEFLTVGLAAADMAGNITERGYY